MWRRSPRYVAQAVVWKGGGGVCICVALNSKVCGTVVWEGGGVNCVAQSSKVCGTGSCLEGGGGRVNLCGTELQGMWHSFLGGGGACVSCVAQTLKAEVASHRSRITMRTTELVSSVCNT